MRVTIADKVGSAFTRLLWQVLEHKATYYFLKGGRGSLKSSFVSIAIVLLMLRDEDYNVLVYMRDAVDLRDSVYEQMQWSIELLGLADRFEFSVSPMRIVYRKTGQRIAFRGADRRGHGKKSKGTKLARGYYAVVWFEEADMFESWAQLQTILQSLFRGADQFWCFLTYNPPESANAWINKEVLRDVPDRIVHTSSYTQAPREWLGEQFIADAEVMRLVNPTKYAHDYEGAVTGTGAEVFHNVEVRELTEEEREYVEAAPKRYGVDWGLVHPWVLTVSVYDPNRLTLYIIESHERYGVPNNQDTAAVVKAALERYGEPYAEVWCDRAEIKSIHDYVSLGITARPAPKGSGSVSQGVKWLAGRARIVIVPSAERAREDFTTYEYKSSGGHLTGTLQDVGDDAIDAVRYAHHDHIRRTI